MNAKLLIAGAALAYFVFKGRTKAREPVIIGTKRVSVPKAHDPSGCWKKASIMPMGNLWNKAPYGWKGLPAGAYLNSSSPDSTSTKTATAGDDTPPLIADAATS